ncbi:MAG: 3-deoxy-manno-octulosonate cytidylyltransferase [Candidatus Marinimicrobia bacterium]|nr:3-deoxy-manno-octulosonate cytidylyltransferase [Candidatus Neomarinimicrobiota bacterium]
MSKIKKYKVIGVIPARYESTRFPGKPLADISGKTMIRRVIDRVRATKFIDKIIVATDDIRIKENVENYNGIVEMTSKVHKSGTERIGEILQKYDAEIIVNIQGDEPLISPKVIDDTIELIKKNKQFSVTTTATNFKNRDEWKNPNRVKVVVNNQNEAMYFTRANIPYPRNEWEKFPPNTFKHLGLYCYRKDAITEFIKLKQAELEKTESLEQLRFLVNGYKIGVLITDEDSLSIDTKDDLENIVKRLSKLIEK